MLSPVTPSHSLDFSTGFCHRISRKPRGSVVCFLVLLLVCSQVSPATSLVSTGAQHDVAPIRRVAVIGTGIAGLSLAHALENSPDLAATGDGTPIEVSLFDSRPALDFGAGAGVQINGGMSVLRKINPQVQRAVANAALPIKRIQSRTKPWFNKDAPFDTLLELDLEKAIKSTGGETEKELIVDGELMCYTIMRGALQETLMSTLPSQTAKRVEFGKTLVGIQASEDGGISCEFEDGSKSDNFDLVVGCDGIKTAVKEYIETGNISAEVNRDSRSAVYSGIRIRYAVQDGDASSPSISEGQLRQYFGDGLYGVSGVYGAGSTRPATKSSFLVFLDEDYIGPFRKTKASRDGTVEENADWKQDIRATGDARTIMLDQLNENGVPAIDIGPVIENSDRFFELGIYLHNPFSLSGWSKEVEGSGGRFCTLAGDAAHAMPPFLGQGSNQAIQDAYCLAKKVFLHNRIAARDGADEVQKMDMKSLLREYEQTRWPKTTSISAKAAFLGYLEAGKGFVSKFRDVFFFTMGKVGVAKKVFLSSAVPKV